MACSTQRPARRAFPRPSLTAVIAAPIAAIWLAGAFAQPAAAQQGLVPTTPSVFGAPSLTAPSTQPEDRPTLPSPADVPNATTSAAKDPNADLAFGAYQRGFYATAMREATRRLALDPKDGAAMTLIGELYSQGLGVKPSQAEAARWFKLGADNGDTQAMFELGMARMKGEGVPQDRAGAKAMFEAAGAHDDPGALFYLGVMALQNNGVSPDYKTAAAYFRRAADGNSSEAQYALGLMYRNGQGVEPDDAKAAAFIHAAADNDNIAAMVEFAIMQFNGVGVPKDEAAAARLFIKAAGHNNPVAQNRAARLYVAGRGVKRNFVEGMKWYMLARSAGLKDAWLDGEASKMTNDERTAVDLAIRRYAGS